MGELSDNLSAMDKLIHESARLVILTALQVCRSADFRFLQRVTGLSKGNLSSHLSKLEEVGLVAIEKQFVGKKPNTVVSLTPEGNRAIVRHWQVLDTMRSNAYELRNRPR